MSPFNIHTGAQLSRRRFLRNAGIAIGLPMLDAMTPAFAAEPIKTPKRFVGVSLSLGLHSPNLVPQDAGFNYQPSQYLRSLQDIRDRFTVISGTSHPGVTGGHKAESSIFSACPNQGGSAERNTISLDQLMAKHLGHETRFPSLVLTTGGQRSPSYTENGAMIPAIDDPRALFEQLFVDDDPKVIRRKEELLRSGKSILDIVGAEAKALQREVGNGDREKLDSWFTSVRELEQRLEMNKQWVNRPKPRIGKQPRVAERDNAADIERATLDIALLALQTDSTRFITLHCTGNVVRGIDGVEESYHGLSHHGLDDDKLRQLTLVEQAMIDSWGNFVRQLKASTHQDRCLLDDTTVLLTSNLGNASSHNTRNMPVLLAGGSFKHGQHLAFDQNDNYPLPNLYLSALHEVGLMHENFATSTGNMKGLERQT
ncbi:DUF1552 domain-containing protein [Roseibacillus persicicus]|uniref:Secreted protein containing DUF1552 n=1 Tax=Roseibacillus persicicus TaxID=454148 RepID=A0A918U0V4_9BACT|nr:DUF1552 domain-containing protein [Roseibacillus persicicus]MDQ8189325.1 DUF1552 domain-containing protein [Roseibacillus persicicus]GHC65286.1 hypothetical protein GCM10007100_36290 [Roseibacillus persicicus]